MLSFLAKQWQRTTAACGRGWDLLRHEGPGQIQFWFIALMVGTAAGFAALIFRIAIERLQTLVYGVEDPNLLHSFVGDLPWWDLRQYLERPGAPSPGTRLVDPETDTGTP